MNVDSILVSEFAAVHEGRLTVVSTFNQVQSSNYPTVLPAVMVSLIIHGYSAEAGTEHEIEIRFINEDREQVGKAARGTFRFGENPVAGLPLRHVQVVRSFGHEIPRAGVYAFEVYIDGTYHAAQAFLAKEV